MRRIHIFEIADKKWCPRSIRGVVTDYIQFGTMKWGVDVTIASVLGRKLERLGVQEVVDLCSGSGGPWIRLFEILNTTWPFSRVCLTDKFPNIPALNYVRQASQGRISFSPESVNAACVPGTLVGFRTIFAAFHHFTPREARDILNDAVNCRQGIGVFEITQRSPRAILSFTVVSILMPLFIPFIRPLRWSGWRGRIWSLWPPPWYCCSIRWCRV